MVVNHLITPYKTNPKPKKIGGRYWMFYHAYPGEGYETGDAANNGGEFRCISLATSKPLG